METKIFKNYEEFFKREDIGINGVTKEFAEKHNINLEEDEDNYGCWNCLRCGDTAYANNCTNCSNCDNCKNCEYCEDLRGLRNYKNNEPRGEYDD